MEGTGQEAQSTVFVHMHTRTFNGSTVSRIELHRLCTKEANTNTYQL
jgi:hypothetical protein